MRVSSVHFRSYNTFNRNQKVKALNADAERISSFPVNQTEISRNALNRLQIKQAPQTQVYQNVPADLYKALYFGRSSGNKPKTPVVIVYPDLAYDDYDDVSDVAKDFGVSSSVVTTAISNYGSFRRMAPILASKAYNENGEINMEAIKEAAGRIKDLSFYLVDKYGDHQWYSSPKECVEVTGLPRQKIYSALHGASKFVDDFVLYKTKDFEIRDENGMITGFDNEKIQRAIDMLEGPRRGHKGIT